MARFQDLGNGAYRVFAPCWTGDRRGAQVGYVLKLTRPHRWSFQATTTGRLHEARTQGWFCRRGDAASALLRTAQAAQPPQARTVSTPQGRAFGVEIEFYGPRASEVIAALTRHGVPTANVGSYQATNGSNWELKHDGSLYTNRPGLHGHELASPKLYGEEGLEQVRLVCEALASIHAIVDRTCGLHVHHDMRGLELNSIRRQVLAFVDRQDIIARLVAPSRRANGYCPNWTPDARSGLLAETDIRRLTYHGPRGNINLQAYSRHGSVELRSHGGTTSYRKIAAWVRFGQKLFEAAEANRTISMTDPRDLLANIGLDIADREILLRFVRAADAAETEAENMEFAVA